MKKNKILFITIFLISVFSFMVGVEANTGITEISGNINYDYINEVLKITNEERAKNNLKPLVLDGELMERANQRAYEIVYSFSHTRPNNTSCFTIIEGLGNTAYGENIAEGYTSPSEVMNGWMNSVHHRENIMAETNASKLFTTIGIGHVSVNGRDYWVQLFGNKLNSELNKTGVVNETKEVEVIIPDGKLDFSKSLINPFESTITLKKAKVDSYDFFIDDKPIINLNGFSVLLNWYDFQIISSDESIVGVHKNSWKEINNSYGIHGVYGKSGSADVTIKYNNEDYIYYVNTVNYDHDTEIIDTVVVNDANLDIKVGDTPIFTGKAGSNKYTITEYWEEYDENLKPYERRTTNPELTSPSELEIEPITKFEDGKTYYYRVVAEINEETCEDCMFKIGEMSLIVNGSKYVVPSTHMLGKILLPESDNTFKTTLSYVNEKQIIKEIKINNATLDIKDGDNVKKSFTAIEDSGIFNIVEIWSQNEIGEETERSDGRYDSEGRIGEFKAGNRYFYKLEISLKPEYLNSYSFPNSYDTPINIIINGKNYIFDNYYAYNGTLHLGNILIIDLESESKNIQIVDRLEVNNVVLDYQAGDKPNFIAKTKDDSYSIVENWVLKYYRIPSEGAIFSINSSDEETNNWYKQNNEYFETFEESKGYSYMLEFNLKDTDNVRYLFPLTGYITVVVNGEEYQISQNFVSHGMTLYFVDNLFVEIPYVVNNVKTDFVDQDSIIFTGSYETNNYTFDEYWTEYVENEGHDFDDKFYNRKGLSTDNSLNNKVTKFEKGKKYSYSLKFHMNCEGKKDSNYYCYNYYLEEGKDIYIVVNGKEYKYRFPNNQYDEWGIKDLFVIEIPENNIPITELVLSKSEVELTEGTEEQITYVINPENTTDSKEVIWKSNDESVAKVENGLIKGIKEGNTTITVTTSNGITKTINVRVNRKLIPVTSIELSEHNMNINGENQLFVIFNPNGADIDYDLLTWSSDDESVLVVVDGTLYPVKQGTTKIRVQYGDLSDEAIINVIGINDYFIGPISINNEEYLLNTRVVYVGNSDELGISYINSTVNMILNNSNNKITWVTGWNDNINVSNNIVSFSKYGNYYVKGILGDYSTQLLNYHVYDVVSDYDKQLYVGDSEKLNLKFIISQSYSIVGQYVWSVDNTDIAAISEDGILTGIKPGKVNVTAYYIGNKNYKYTFEIDILKRDDNIFEVYYDEDNQNIILKNSNGTVTLVINDVTNKIDEENKPEIENQEAISIFDIYFEKGDNYTFENPIYKVRIPINFDINKYDNLYLYYIKDGKIIETFDYKIIDNKYMEFITNHFSNYAIYGTLKSDLNSNQEIKNVISNPQTSDSITQYFTISLLSIMTLLVSIIIIIYKRKNKNDY